MERIVFAGEHCSKCAGDVVFCWSVDCHGGMYIRSFCDACDLVHPAGVSNLVKRQCRLDFSRLPRFLNPSERKSKSKVRIPKGEPGYKPRNWHPGCKPKPVKTPSVSTAEVKLLCSMPYKDYLKSDHWRATRAAALVAAGFRCQLCNSPDSLAVHHRTYERRGHEAPADLTVLCSPCHAKFHDILPNPD